VAERLDRLAGLVSSQIEQGFAYLDDGSGKPPWASPLVELPIGVVFSDRPAARPRRPARLPVAA
jgi:hypothetical protein